MIEYLEENKLGERKVQYKLRDWSVSRQRFWASVMPIWKCTFCNEEKIIGRTHYSGFHSLAERVKNIEDQLVHFRR